MSCVAQCSGFRSLRAECIADPCLFDNLCYSEDASFPLSSPCAQWCCVSHGAYIMWIVLLLSGGLFLLCVAHYLKWLHQINVGSGAVKEIVVDPNTNKKIANEMTTIATEKKAKP